MEERAGFPFSGLVLLVCAVSMAALFVTSRAQTRERDGERKVSDEAAGQIRSMLDEKETRSPAQKKIDSQLLYALKQKRGDLRGVPSAPKMTLGEFLTTYPLAPEDVDLTAPRRPSRPSPFVDKG